MNVEDLKKAVPLQQRLDKLEYLFDSMSRSDLEFIQCRLGNVEVAFSPQEICNMIEGPMQGLVEDLADLGIEQ